MEVVRQSTARTVIVGPILDASGVAVTDGVVGDLKISKNGAAPAALNGSATLTHRHTGHYSLALTASDTDTVGGAQVTIDDTVNAMPPKELTVVEEAVYDALFAASALGYVANAPVNVAQFGGSNGTFASGRPEVNTTHWGGTAVASANVLIDGAITAAKIASDAITSAKVADGFLTAAKFASGAFDAVWSVTTRILTAATNITSTGGTTVPQTGDNYARLGAPAGASVSADMAAVKSDTGTLVSRITSTLFSGITSLAEWLGLLAGKQTGDTTARTELRATGAGSGTFDETTDSQEALRDRGDAAWTTAAGFSTHSATDVWAAGTRTLTAGDNIVLAKGTGVTGFNDLSAAQVNAEADTALSDYGALKPTTAGRTLDVTAGGTAGVDWANVEAPTTTVDLSGTTISTSQAVASVSGAVGSVTGAVGSVTGAVGSVTGNVGGNVTGSVGSVSAGGITASSIATGAIDADALAADAIDEILDEQIGDSTITMRQALKLLVATLGGKVSGAATTTVTFRNAADSSDVVTATVDADGNRSAVTLNL